MSYIVLRRVMLFQQNLGIRTVPSPGPVLVRPAKAKWKFRLARSKNFSYWPFQDPPAIEPIMVITETINPVLMCHFSLRFPHLGKPQIVKAKVCG